MLQPIGLGDTTNILLVSADMKLEQIKQKAEQEVQDIGRDIDAIRKSIISNPNGMDLYVPYSKLSAIERYCDQNSIPCMLIGDDCMSVAATYSQLFAYESRR